jgi:hypothetical protein
MPGGAASQPPRVGSLSSRFQPMARPTTWSKFGKAFRVNVFGMLPALEHGAGTGERHKTEQKICGVQTFVS